MIKFKKVNESAVIPRKAGENEVGYDLTAIKLDKVDGNIHYFDTGIQVEPPNGYYLEIIPRSSIVKTGYILANSVGIIDPTYRGNIKIVLIRTNFTLHTLTPPFCKCQLVVRKLYNLDSCVVEELSDTERGGGGFGSTDDKSKSGGYMMI